MPRIEPLEEAVTPTETRIAYNQHRAIYSARITNMKATLGHSYTAFQACLYAMVSLIRRCKGYIREKTFTTFRMVYIRSSRLSVVQHVFQEDHNRIGRKPGDSASE